MSGDADDKTLMVRFQAEGDLRAFETLFQRNKDALFRFLLRLSGSEHIAQDVSQHAWLRIIEIAEAGGFDPASSAAFQTFLFTLARNRFIDEHVRRHEVVRTESLTDHEASETGGATDADELSTTLEHLQTRAQLHAALFELPFEQREVLALWMQGFELQEIATMTRVSWHTVVSRKKYALRKLAAMLGGGTPAQVPT